MKTLFYGGLLFSGYALFQGLGFIAKAYPVTSSGVSLVIFLSFTILLIFGFNNLCGYYRNDGYIDRTQTIISFAPVFALGSLIVVAIISGIYAAS